jgi:hypothetical protein
MPGKVTVTGQSEDADARFILPVISPEGENVAWQDANTVRIGSGPAALTVQADRPLTLPPERIHHGISHHQLRPDHVRGADRLPT